MSLAEDLESEPDAMTAQVERLRRRVRSLVTTSQTPRDEKAVVDDLAVCVRGVGDTHERLRGENDGANLEAEATNSAKDRLLADGCRGTLTAAEGIFQRLERALEAVAVRRHP